MLADLLGITIADAQIIAEVEAARKTLAEAKETINAAKEKQKAAQADCKRLEKEMDDFKNNKDSKLKEIKVRLRPFGMLSLLTSRPIS